MKFTSKILVLALIAIIVVIILSVIGLGYVLNNI